MDEHINQVLLAKLSQTGFVVKKDKETSGKTSTRSRNYKVHLTGGSNGMAPSNTMPG